MPNFVANTVSIERLDEALLDALVRLVELLEDPALVPRLAPLIQQEITIRLLTGRYGPQLQHLVAVDPRASKLRKPSPGSSKISLTCCTSTTWQLART
jgi:AraC-type transcriptional regulator N-terminus